MSTREFVVSFAPDSRKIEIRLEPFLVIADGGDRTEPSPGVLFLSGLAACTASTARYYCFTNSLPMPTGLKARVETSEQTHLIERVELQLLVPPDFPPERLDALAKAAESCTVKKWWQSPPEFTLQLEQAQTA